jgi:UDP-N-acetylglucosamine--N-acetylmuramyl-(pentapeptide) pyrophosphoryl-undecaprenol N-acetylglucosamine transferase
MQSLRQMRPEATFSWIGTRGGVEERVVGGAGLPFYAVSSGKLRRYFSWQNFTDVLRIFAGFVQAFFLLGKLRASVVVSAGGFVAVPVAWAAWLRRIPVHVHQQDVRPGLANKLTLPVAASMSVALESSVVDFPRQRPTWTGNPVRPEVLRGSLDEAHKVFGLEDGVPVVLVLGGGTGALGLNKLVWESLPMLADKAQVIHAAGVGKMNAQATSPRYHQFELLTGEQPHAFAAADIVVTRAGMGTLTELASLGKPTIIVPMPNSHQADNAFAFAERSGAIELDEGETDAGHFAETVLGLLFDSGRRDAIARGMREMNSPDAAERIAQMILADAEKK